MLHFNHFLTLGPCFNSILRICYWSVKVPSVKRSIQPIFDIIFNISWKCTQQKPNFASTCLFFNLMPFLVLKENETKMWETYMRDEMNKKEPKLEYLCLSHSITKHLYVYVYTCSMKSNLISCLPNNYLYRKISTQGDNNLVGKFFNSLFSSSIGE